MHFSSPPQLEHPTVRLRALVAADLAPWFAVLSDPRVHEHTSWHVQAPADLLPYVWKPEENTASSAVRWAIARRSDDVLVGSAGFHTVWPQHRSAEIAYDLAAACWGLGIGTAVCTALRDWAHRDAALTRVQATVLQSNLRSAAVLERCGFQREGLLHAYRNVRGVPGNFHMYAHVTLPPAG